MSFQETITSLRVDFCAYGVETFAVFCVCNLLFCSTVAMVDVYGYAIMRCVFVCYIYSCFCLCVSERRHC